VIFAATYDRMTARTEAAGLSAHRDRLLAAAAGRVLEIGGGTGQNLRCYGQVVTALTVTEPERPMAKRLRARVAAVRPGTQVVEASAEQLPFPDDSFDTVVSTLVLCTVADQARALAEIGRVLAPDGQLLFIEHVRAETPRLAWVQDHVNPIQRVLAHGCNCNRRTLDAMRAAGFSVGTLERGELKNVPPFARPLIIGSAVRAPDPVEGSRLGWKL
jgi:ubiquinone/menaquinone biosynthesis C-methylase UbiE